jgi:hypothetical protein
MMAAHLGSSSQSSLSFFAYRDRGKSPGPDAETRMVWAPTLKTFFWAAFTTSHQIPRQRSGGRENTAQKKHCAFSETGQAVWAQAVVSSNSRVAFAMADDIG